MDTIQTAPVSGLQNNYQEVLKQVADGPVLLLEAANLLLYLSHLPSGMRLQRA